MYDVIVIGSDLSSLIAALLTARYGRKTLLLSECGLGDSITFSDFTFNVDPFPWSGFGAGQILPKLLSELNIPLPDPARISPLNPAFQIVQPDHRVDFFIEKEALIEDIGREYPSEGRHIGNLYSSVTKVCDILDKSFRESLDAEDETVKGLMKHWLDIPFSRGEIWQLSRKLRSLDSVHSLGSMLNAHLALLSSEYVNHDKPLSAAYLLSLPWRGLYYHFGGKHVLLGQFRRRFEELRGERMADCLVTAVRSGGKIEVDVKQKGKPVTVVAQDLVISSKSPSLPILLSQEGKLARLARRHRTVNTVLYPFTLHMGISSRGLPERMSEYVIVVPETGGNDSPTESLIFLESSVADDAGLAPRGKRTLTATAFFPRSPRDLSDDELRSSASAMMEKLEGFLPFLREHLAFLDVDRSIDVCRQYQQVVNPRYRFSGPLRRILPTFPVRSPHRNIFLTGGMTFAGFGFEGEVLSGIKAGYHATGGAEI